ncbi:MAG: tRNA pseudouridine(38-40) synthase TruA [Balneolaceae bacterium]|nr:tRNA pseudouridine(38-40) synthase TruA [Balneolaceae bacterium]
MPRYKITIEYDGTNYLGWQRQPEGPTVEKEIEDALSRILQQPINIVGQGRTDSGVHAEGQVAHFDFPEPLVSDQLCYALLGVLPRDIAVYQLVEVPDDFHARFDAKSRRYRYQFVTRPSPLRHRHAGMVLNDLDFDAMNECAAMVCGVHDFESFVKSNADQEHAKCEVLTSEFSRQGHLVCYHIEANRFLHHLVRRLAGTMIEVGKGNRTIAEFKQLLQEPRTDISGHGAQAKGLILETVNY